MHVLAARKKQCQYLSPSVLEAVVVKICFRRGHIQSSQVQVLVPSYEDEVRSREQALGPAFEVEALLKPLVLVRASEVEVRRTLQPPC